MKQMRLCKLVKENNRISQWLSPYFFFLLVCFYCGFAFVVFSIFFKIFWKSSLIFSFFCILIDGKVNFFFINWKSISIFKFDIKILWEFVQVYYVWKKPTWQNLKLKESIIKSQIHHMEHPAQRWPLFVHITTTVSWNVCCVLLFSSLNQIILDSD